MKPQEQADIVDACQTHERNHWQDRDYRAAIFVGTDYFVKYGHVRALATEVATQRYISAYALAQSTAGAPGIPRIPGVVSYFKHESKAYLVSEYVKLADSPLDPESTAAALKWLSEVPLPPNHVIGPVGGGRIRHRFFKDYEAPLCFSSVEALERYIEKGRNRLSKQSRGKVPAVRIIGEPSAFMQPDVHPSNFGRDEHGNAVIMDFAEIAPLPQSFAAFTIGSSPSLAPFIEFLGLANNDNVRSMCEISWLLRMTGDPKLGLNNDGFPKVS